MKASSAAQFLLWLMSPISNWSGSIGRAYMRDIFSPDEPITWRELSPFHREKPTPISSFSLESDGRHE